MSQTNGEGTPADPLAEAFKAVTAEHAALVEERDRLEGQWLQKRDEMSVEIKRREKILRAAGLLEFRSQGRPRNNRKRYSDATLDRVRAAVAKQDGEFTARVIHEESRVSLDVTMAALEQLRGQGEIRLVGARRPDGARSGHKARHFAKVGD